MHIAGGLYRELCETPTWNAQFGSGGRAAAAVSAMSPGSTLHTYAQDGNNPGAEELSALGVQLSRTHSDIAIAFAYFHPLSQPHIEPRPGTITQQPPIHVTGEVVLRFGFLEGSALVHAAKAIYDPQSAVHPEPFGANGSTAKRLALVMNELELCQYTGCPDLATAAGRAMSNDNQVTVIVVKRGVRGVTVYERNAEPITVPAYYSSQVFKIGTGDVFSAVFAHHWGEAGASPPEAADLASRSVSAYCETRTLPVRIESLKSREPVTGDLPSQLILHGSTSTIGRRYTLEEARFRLKELGIDAFAPQLDEIPEPYSKNLPSLVVADGLSTTEIKRLCETNTCRSVVILDEERRNDVSELSSLGVNIISDFATALYQSAWPRAFFRS